LKPVGEVGFEDRLATLAGTPAEWRLALTLARWR
jgi:hypothetical protein